MREMVPSAPDFSFFNIVFYFEMKFFDFRWKRISWLCFLFILDSENFEFSYITPFVCVLFSFCVKYSTRQIFCSPLLILCVIKIRCKFIVYVPKCQMFPHFKYQKKIPRMWAHLCIYVVARTTFKQNDYVFYSCHHQRKRRKWRKKSRKIKKTVMLSAPYLLHLCIVHALCVLNYTCWKCSLQRVARSMPLFCSLHGLIIQSFFTKWWLKKHNCTMQSIIDCYVRLVGWFVGGHLSRDSVFIAKFNESSPECGYRGSFLRVHSYLIYQKNVYWIVFRSKHITN